MLANILYKPSTLKFSNNPLNTTQESSKRKGIAIESQSKDIESIENIDLELGTVDNEVTNTNEKKDIGIISAIFLILNRMIGTGIFATPSAIYMLSGSIGSSLLIWVAGSCIAASGLMVYLEWGVAIPKNGGEKNYLQHFYTTPKHLVMTMFAVYALLLGWAASNSVVFGEFVLTAAGIEPGRWNQRLIGLACITFSFLVNSINVKLGLWCQNVLGSIKLGLIALIIITGFVGLGGGLPHVPHNDNLSKAFDQTHVPSAYGVVMALYNVIWSFIGYSNANYALGEAKNPVRTLKISAPIALGLVSVLYILINIAFFAVVPRHELQSSGRILAATFFRMVFGENAQRVLSVFVALSSLGNVMAVIFAQGRIVQELGKDGLLPFSKFFASYRPFGTPMAGLFAQWAVSVVIILAPPPGDAYNFIINLISYPLSIVNVMVALGLIVMNLNREKYKWRSPIKATLPVSGFFFLSSLYLVIAPYIPPVEETQNIYTNLPYWLHCVVGTLIFVAGAVYWVVRFKVLPRYFPVTFSTERKTYHPKESE